MIFIKCTSIKLYIWPRNDAWPHKQAVVKVRVRCLIPNKRRVEQDQGTAVTSSRDAAPVMRAKGGTREILREKYGELLLLLLYY